MSRVLVTRPRDESESLARELVRLGHQVLIEPMLEIEFRAGPAPDLTGSQGLLFTSANGVRALARLVADRRLPVFAVGHATAAAAAAAGFRRVASAAGDVMALARLVAGRCDPAAGPLFHGAASERAGDLAGELEKAGFTVSRQVLYQARPALGLSVPTVQALAGGDLDLVLLFSPRTARAVAGLIDAAGLAAACRRVTAVCLSAAVAEAAMAPLGDGLAALPWRRVRVAARPEQEALLAVLGEEP